MINIPIRTSECLNSDNILSINHTRVQEALTRENLASVNHGTACRMPDIHSAPGVSPSAAGRHMDNTRHASSSGAAAGSQQAPFHSSAVSSGQAPGFGAASGIQQAGVQQGARHNAGQTLRPAMTGATVSNTVSASPIPRRMPALRNLVQKGQKLNIGTAGQLKRLKIAMGWDTTDSRCDIDLSAYLLDGSGRVPGDDWFVFYGQTTSPDGSVSLDVNGSVMDREIVEIDFTRLKPVIRKIVFVLTINEAFAHHLNFSMAKDAYIRLLDADTDREILSFLLTDYYANVTSMMLGEVYLYNDTWKFSAIGNGVARDLAGLCELYGVQTN